MKKIALLLIVATLLSVVFAAIPASAAELETAAINFTALDYQNRDWKSHKAYTQEEFNALITTETKANSLSTYATDANAPKNSDDEDNFATAYFSKMFPITEQTDVTLYVNAKNHRVGGYCGLIFAADAEDHPYFIYGALANGRDDDTGRCEIRARYRYHNNDSSIGSQLSGTSFKVTQELVDGFGQYKIVYKGLTVTVYTKTADGWVQVTFGDDMKNFTLKEGSYISLGIYSRHGHAEKKRTATIINPTIEATAADLKAMLGIYAKVKLVAPKTIARSEGKAVRIIDKRKI